MRVNEQPFGLDQPVTGGAPSAWWAVDATAEIRRVLRQNDVAFRWFVAGCIAVGVLIMAAMLLG